jgi:hypothetical protein
MNVVTAISYDVADKLPPRARDRFLSLRQSAADTHAVLRPIIEQLSDLFPEKQRHERRLKLITGPGYSLDKDAIQVKLAQADLDRCTETIARLKTVEKERSARWHAAAQTERIVEDWLGSGVPRGCTIVDHEPIDAAALLKKNETLIDAVERVRRRGREIAADLNRVRTAPHPSADRKLAMRQQVDALAELAAPHVSASIAIGSPIEFPTENVRVDVHNAPGAVGFTDVPNALGLLCWLHRDALISKLDSEIDAEADDAIALNDADRAKQEAVILGDIVSNDRDECALIELGAKQGIVIEHRADVSPLALLGLSLVTPTRGLVAKLIGSQS